MFVAYVETTTGGGRDEVFETAAAAWEWVDERLSTGSYHDGDVTDENGNQAPRPA